MSVKSDKEKELENKIEKWKEEIKIYEHSDAEGTIVKRKILLNLIQNAKKEIESIHMNQQKPQWHPDLTEEQIDYIRSELDIYEPVGQEYEQALRQLGIKINKQPIIQAPNIENKENKPIKPKKAENKEDKSIKPKKVENKEDKPIKPQKVEPKEDKPVEPQKVEPEEDKIIDKEQNKKKNENETVRISFKASTRTYTLEKTEKSIKEKFSAITSKDIKIDDIMSDKRFKEFWGKFVKACGEIKGIDPYLTYILATSGVKSSSKIIKEYIDVMKGKKEVGEEGIDSLKIKYDMSGIYDKQYPEKISDELMNCANAHSNKKCATVIKNRSTAFLEKHKTLRKIYNFFTRRKEHEDRLMLPEGKIEDTSSNNRNTAIPTYSKETLEVLKADTYEDLQARYFNMKSSVMFSLEENKAIAARMLELSEKEKNSRDSQKMKLNKQNKKGQSR